MADVQIQPVSDPSARAIIDSTLSQYGLESLSDWAWGRYLSGAPVDTIIFEMRSRPEYKQRFPAMDALAQSGHAINESQYIAYETAATGLLRQYGIPAGFYDQPDDFTALLKNQVSVAELSQRLASYNDVANAQDPEVLNQLNDLYGITPGQLTAYFIDPARATPMLQRQAAAAVTSAQAVGSGFGALTQAEAERYAGANPSSVGQLGTLGELLTGLPGDNNPGVSRETALSAVLDQSGQAQQQVQLAQRRRVTPFEQGGGFTGGQQGLTGVGATTP